MKIPTNHPTAKLLSMGGVRTWFASGAHGMLVRLQGPKGRRRLALMFAIACILVLKGKLDGAVPPRTVASHKHYRFATSTDVPESGRNPAQPALQTPRQGFQQVCERASLLCEQGKYEQALPLLYAYWLRTKLDKRQRKRLLRDISTCLTRIPNRRASSLMHMSWSTPEGAQNTPHRLGF